MIPWKVSAPFNIPEMRLDSSTFGAVAEEGTDLNNPKCDGSVFYLLLGVATRRHNVA